MAAKMRGLPLMGVVNFTLPDLLGRAGGCESKPVLYEGYAYCSGENM